MGGEPNASRGVCGVSDEPEPPLCCRAELRVLLSSAAPLSLFGFVQFAMSAVSIAFVGRLGSQALAAAALGGSFANVVGVSLLFGFTLPLDTICSQAFGAGRFRSLGVAVQRTLCVNLALCVLVSLVWAHADALFLVMGQDAELAALAGRYTRTLIPHAWLASGQFPLQKALQAQGVMAPFAAVGVVLLGFHIGVTDYMVRHHGFVGAALSQSYTDALSLILTVAVYVRHELALPPDRRTWPGAAGLPDALLRGWAPYFALALPSVVCTIVEWSTFEIITVLSGLLPGRESGAPTSASAICINSIMLAFAIPLGLSNAASARVGVVLGAGRPEAARLAGTVAFGVALAVESAVAFSLLFVGGDRFAELFAGSGEDGAPTRDAFRTLVPPLALILFGDGLQATLSGVVRGAGLQATALKLNLLSFYAIGLPLGVALAFGPPRAGLVGLWSGVALAVIMQFFLLGSLLNGLRWDERARAADDAAKHGPGEAVGGEAGAGAGGEDDDDDEDGF